MQFLGEHDKWEAAQLAVLEGHVTLEWEGQVYDLPTPHQLGEWTDDLHVAPIGPWYDSDPRHEWQNGQQQAIATHAQAPDWDTCWQSLRCHTCTGQRTRRNDKPCGLALHSQCACGSTFRSTCSRPDGRRKAAGWIFPPSSGKKAAEWSQLASPSCASDHREGPQGLRKPLGVEQAPAGSLQARPSEREQREREEGEIDKRTMKIVQREIEKFREQWLTQPHTPRRGSS
jgi:hypothetical protein